MDINYTSEWPRCAECGQLIRTDADLAYKMFADASLAWDGKPIDHYELRDLLLGDELWIERESGGKFNRPEEYGLNPLREWCRRELGRTGVVVVDIDAVVRRYGDRFGLDAVGDQMLVEIKEHH